MWQLRRSRRWLPALLKRPALHLVTVCFATGLVGVGIAWSQMGQGRAPMGGAPSNQPVESAPPAKGPRNGAAPPFDLHDPQVIKEGSILFATTCSYCHKKTTGPGAPGAAPSLWDHAYEQDYLFRMISEGPPSRRMPAWKFQYSPEQIWKLVAYVLTFKEAETK
jgi:mono/diheme cytochrome c family protein